MFHATTTFRTALLLGALAIGGLATAPHHATAPEPSAVLVDCADTGCATAPRYRDNQTVNIIWTKHPVPPASQQPITDDPGVGV